MIPCHNQSHSKTQPSLSTQIVFYRQELVHFGIASYFRTLSRKLLTILESEEETWLWNFLATDLVNKPLFSMYNLGVIFQLIIIMMVTNFSLVINYFENRDRNLDHY